MSQKDSRLLMVRLWSLNTTSNHLLPTLLPKLAHPQAIAKCIFTETASWEKTRQNLIQIYGYSSQIRIVDNYMELSR